jgi:hypothetical protein
MEERDNQEDEQPGGEVKHGLLPPLLVAMTLS